MVELIKEVHPNPNLKMGAAMPENPKRGAGLKKVPMSTVSCPVLMEIGVGMLEGELKYARHNYRAAPILGSDYYDAVMRHLMVWWEGEDTDQESAAKLNHITKAITTLVVLRDAMIQNTFIDDRPLKTAAGWMVPLNDKSVGLREQFPNPKPPYTAIPLRPR